MTTAATESTPAVDLASIAARLEAIDRKLDYVVERQEFLEDMIDEMIPVAREALKMGGEVLGEYEQKGYFAVGRELLAVADQVVETYGPGEVREMGGHIVQLLDTVKNLTQPDVLDVANKATDVVHHADDVAPVGMFGAVRATQDKDIQKGLGMALQILRHLGRAQGGTEVERHAAPPPSPSTSGDAGSAPRPPRPTATATTTPTPAADALHPPTETVTWNGRAFTSEGFLVDAATWDEDLAHAMAAALDLTLTEDHWTVIRWARADFLESGASPNVRRVATGSGVGTRRMYELFPKSPGKTTSMLAGIPKPAGCV